jgi:hypothetical protein
MDVVIAAPLTSQRFNLRACGLDVVDENVQVEAVLPGAEVQSNYVAARVALAVTRAPSR